MRRPCVWASTPEFWTCSVPRPAQSIGSIKCPGVASRNMLTPPEDPFASMGCWRDTRSKAAASACTGFIELDTWSSRRIPRPCLTFSVSLPTLANQFVFFNKVKLVLKLKIDIVNGISILYIKKIGLNNLKSVNNSSICKLKLKSIL